MKKISTLLLLVLFSKFSFSQTIETVTYNDDPLLKISLNNLILLEQMTFVSFNSLMTRYHYTYQANGDNYRWQGGGTEAPLFAVAKDAQKSAMLWSNNQLEMVGQLRDDLSKYFVGYRDGNSLYRLSNSGRHYEILLGNAFAILSRKP